MTIQLFHCINARSFRVLWTFKEMGLTDYKLIMMPFPPRLHVPEFTKVNALGTVPYFVDGDTRMTESSGIPLYLVEKYCTPQTSLLKVSPSDSSYGEFINWLFHSDATLTFPQTVVIRYSKMEPEKGLQTAVKDYSKWYIARLRLLNETLKDGRQFLCEDRFTIADITVTYALALGGYMDLDLEQYYKPQTLEYINRMMMARPGYIAAQDEQVKAASCFDERGNAKL